jgi:site-specific DNA recombinase
MGKQVARAREEWIPIQVPAIIDPEIFAHAQKLKAYKQKVLKGYTKNKYLLKGRISCVKCGYAARGQVVKGKHQYYICNGRRQIVSLCDMPNVRGDWVDEITWEWVKGIIENPKNLRMGLENLQNDSQRVNETLYGRLALIDEQIQDNQKQLDKLLDLYLTGDFPKEMLTERKERLEQISANLLAEKSDLTDHISQATITDDQLAYIEEFCAKIRDRLNQADFEAKR